jgi:predicted protein tyrosine phosphatase
MPRLHVCSLAMIDDMVAQTGARSMVTLLSPGTKVNRPTLIAAERHLNIAMSDIVEAMDGQVLPDETHIEALIAFVKTWDRREPMLIHCYAGISRSTAQALRAASPTATPNARFVALADERLGRGGRMSAAIAAIGRGTDAFEGVPFALEL